MGLYRPTVNREIIASPKCPKCKRAASNPALALKVTCGKCGKLFSARRREKSPIWWGRYRDPRNNEPVCVSLQTADEKAAKIKLAELERRAAQEFAGLVNPYEKHVRTPLIKHYEDYKAVLLARQQSGDLAARYVSTVLPRVKRVIEGCGFESFADVSGGKLDTFTASLTCGTRTKNFHVTAFKVFLNWLKDEKRIPENPVADKELITVTDEEPRRPLTDAELTRLIATAKAGRSLHGVSGQERAAIYSLAVSTGFRYSECRSLRWCNLDIDAERPTATVHPKYSKRRKQDVQPLNADTVRMLREWKAEHPDAQPLDPVFPTIPEWLNGSKMFAFDRKAAGIPYRTPDGIVVFHCLRNTYISNLSRAGIDGTTRRELARHSDSRLTDKYSKTFLPDQYDAISRLPKLAAVQPALAAKAG